jgi:hypothetical protein
LSRPKKKKKKKKKKPHKMNDCIYSQFFLCPKSKMKNPEKINEEIKRNLEPNGKGGSPFTAEPQI